MAPALGISPLDTDRFCHKSETDALSVLENYGFIAKYHVHKLIAHINGVQGLEHLTKFATSYSSLPPDAFITLCEQPLVAAAPKRPRREVPACAQCDERYAMLLVPCGHFFSCCKDCLPAGTDTVCKVCNIKAELLQPVALDGEKK
jgi:hypothetical protein